MSSRLQDKSSCLVRKLCNFLTPDSAISSAVDDILLTVLSVNTTLSLSSSSMCLTTMLWRRSVVVALSRGDTLPMLVEHQRSQVLISVSLPVPNGWPKFHPATLKRQK